MATSDLDNPLILAKAFYPRRTPMGSLLPNVQDGTIPVGQDVVLGYRLYSYEYSKAVIVYFHGNGETASDYDMIALFYQQIGVSLLVVDYRGYGWSSGQPTFSTLLSDTNAVHAALPSILLGAGIADTAQFVMGRSIGSAPAIHMAYTFPTIFRGLILDSAFADVLPLLITIGVSPTTLATVTDTVENRRKISAVKLPLLVLHGEQDTLIPIPQGQALYDSSAAKDKMMVSIAHAGHNNILAIGLERYFKAMNDFISGCTRHQED